MGSRTQHKSRGTRWITRIAALCPALAVLLAALAICLGLAAHSQSAPATGAMTTMSAAAVVTDVPAEHHAPASAHPADCHPGDACCHPVVGVRAVLATPVQYVPAILPRMPDLPRQPDTSSRTAAPAPACRAPDLHVLQVQRT
ncbi:hypothetical protein [Streptomyces sp. GESEQ-35]|uniref:hypothetical protein n=1 Tax=Streptomyces sp. GESEQ-35 TaxID=2812657 RepID=UPI001B345376|nr:hypothetical protein [Streptomyces sp. GESEQ-35]